jgi:hypothetical protein
MKKTITTHAPMSTIQAALFPDPPVPAPVISQDNVPEVLAAIADLLLEALSEAQGSARDELEDRA